MAVHEHHVVAFGSGQLSRVASEVAGAGRSAVTRRGGRMFGVWKPLIGLSLNHVVVVTEWPDEAAASANAHAAIESVAGLSVKEHDLWLPTLRPLPEAVPPLSQRREGGYVTHRWYDIAEADLARFLDYSSSTWGNWEGTHDGEVLGLWRTAVAPAPGLIRMRLMAWYRDLGVWERSRYWKKTPGAETANQNLGARYAMTIDSAVSILEAVAAAD